MDLAIGAKSIFIMMDLLTKTGESKLVERCTYPLTGIGCVRRIHTDIATFDITDKGVVASDLVPGLDFDELERICGVKLHSA